MRFPFATQPAIFLERPNRFLVLACLKPGGESIYAHCADSGRLGELLIPGTVVHVSPAAGPSRKTAYDLRFVEHPETGQLISLDSRLPTLLFWEGIHEGLLAPFADYTTIEREVAVPFAGPTGIRSRLDFRLVESSGRSCWVEIKSVTLVEDGAAKFPDAVTARGRRHLGALMTLQASGDRTVMVFMVQRPDAKCFQPHWEADPAFCAALAEAERNGVELYAYTCLLSTSEVSLGQSIPVITH